MEIDRLKQALLNPAAYPHPVDRVELIETYISLVFLARGYAYKVKKPVGYGYLDFTTLEKRKYYCGRELELNRRLCPDVYLAVVPIFKDNGGFCVGGGLWEGVEYAVKMKRLPQDRMLDVLLAENKVFPDMMVALAEKVAEFHKSAETSDKISKFGGIKTIMDNAVENFAQTKKYIGEIITPSQWEAIKDDSGDFIAHNTALFNSRAKQGKIRDCHGDLHSKSVCFAEDGIKIFDCIEFNDRFRYGDTVSEVAFLAMDLDFHNRRDLSKVFVDAYVEASGDDGLLSLLDFYKVYRAYVRGKVNCFRSEGLEGQEREERVEVVEAAREYFRLAESYIKR